MSSIEIIGFAAAVLIGVSLGLIGGGGSILTLPVMVYLLSISPVVATAYSLFVVGATSLVGSFSFMKKKSINYQAALVFAIPSFTTVFLTRKYLVPAIPDPLLSFSTIEISKNVAIMVFFGCIMLAASYSMIKSKKEEIRESNAPLEFNYPMIGLEGALVGVLTGIVGAGGGFLIIPALVLFARLPMKMAVGTSLLIIAAKSLIGFLGDLSHLEVQWSFLLPFTAFSVSGIFVGAYLSKFISGEKLKKAFGWFVLIMGVYIIVKEIIF
jgi:uncharacterized protein